MSYPNNYFGSFYNDTFDHRENGTSHGAEGGVGRRMPSQLLDSGEFAQFGYVADAGGDARRDDRGSPRTVTTSNPTAAQAAGSPLNSSGNRATPMSQSASPHVTSAHPAPSSRSPTDVSGMSLPPEALGARELVDYVFSPPSSHRVPSALSPPNVEMRPKPQEIGLPLPMPTGLVNPQTGRRLVYMRRGAAPETILAESRHRFAAVAFKPLFDPGAGKVGGGGGRAVGTLPFTSYGTILGYSDDNTEIVWHERSERFASRVSLSAILTIHRAAALQCRHCGQIQLRPELREHMSTHKKGSGFYCGVLTDDSVIGMACGDTGLIQNLTSLKRLGEGAQGVVDLFEVIQPTAEELARLEEGSMAYRYISQHLSDERRLDKVVVKTMLFESAEQALAQYQQSVRFMTVMQNPHVVEYLAVQLPPDKRTVKITMPFYKEGDVATMIRNFRGDHLEEHFISTVALQLVNALEFLHERNPPIVHGDLKVENVMFYNNQEQVVLMDMDASCEVRDNQTAVKSSVGTTAYMAPETLNNSRLMPASDMWSLGVFLFVLTVLPDFPMIMNPNTGNMELLNAQCWASPEELEAIQNYEHDAITASPSVVNIPRAAQASRSTRITLGECVGEQIARRGYSKDLVQLVVDTLSYNPWKRPTAGQVRDRLTEKITKDLLGDDYQY